MQILIDVKSFPIGCPQSYKDKLNELNGTWVDVETEYLFKDQFNTKELRIMARHVKEVKDDIRKYRKRCNYCGRHSALVDKKCKHCNRNDYFENLLYRSIIKTKHIPEKYITKEYIDLVNYMFFKYDILTNAILENNPHYYIKFEFKYKIGNDDVLLTRYKLIIEYEQSKFDLLYVSLKDMFEKLKIELKLKD